MEPEYVPTPREIWGERTQFIRWLRERNWNERLVAEIMLHDNPNIETVNRLIDKYGEDNAYLLLMRFVDRGNDDGCQ